MRSVRSAIWTSGDPVSVSWSRCSSMVAVVSGMDLSWPLSDGYCRRGYRRRPRSGSPDQRHAALAQPGGRSVGPTVPGAAGRRRPPGCDRSRRRASASRTRAPGAVERRLDARRRDGRPGVEPAVPSGRADGGRRSRPRRAARRRWPGSVSGSFSGQAWVAPWTTTSSPPVRRAASWPVRSGTATSRSPWTTTTGTPLVGQPVEHPPGRARAQDRHGRRRRGRPGRRRLWSQPPGPRGGRASAPGAGRAAGGRS